MADLLGVTIGQIVTALGYDGTAFCNLRTDAAGHLQVDALTSPLPADAATQTTLAAVLTELLTHTLGVGASTSAKQDTQTTALQLIDDLQKALQSVATDRLKVRGEDQIFTYKGPLGDIVTGAISGAAGFIASTAVTVGEVWVVEHIAARDITTATTVHAYGPQRGATFYRCGETVAAIAANIFSYFHGTIILAAGQTMRAYFTGGLAADQCTIHLSGHIMTKEV